MNQYLSLTIDEIKDKVNALKKRNLPNVITNYYWQNKGDFQKFGSIVGDDSIFFVEKDNDFFRLFFYSVNEQEFNTILSAINFTPLVIDYVTNDPLNTIKDIFVTNGFHQHAKMLRFRNADIPQLKTSPGIDTDLKKSNKILERLEKFFISSPVKDVIHFATDKDIESILNLLYSGLDKYTGHFPSASELLALVNKEQVLVIRDDMDVVSGIVIFKLTGKTCNLDQGYSSPLNDELINVKLFFEFYRILNRKEIKSMYLWVEERNKIVINLHKTFGLKPDGVIDYVYIRN